MPIFLFYETVLYRIPMSNSSSLPSNITCRPKTDALHFLLPGTRCFVKADTLPPEMAAGLTKQHGKTRFSIAEPDLKALTETVNKLSTSVGDAQEQGAGIVDEEISELFAELDIEPGKPVEGEAVSATQGWTTIEDDEEVMEALRLDAVDEMAELLAGTQVTTGGDEEDEVEGGSDNDNSGPGSGSR